jgi:adenosylcobinamide kinase/adenosylcobinamide-phosphate guanylyltransferase
MITFITGGSGSGKTSLALNIASKYNKKIYLATAEYTDNEMTEKIINHQKERDDSYITVEEPVEIHKYLLSINNKADILIIDCITFWTNNLIYYNKDLNLYFTKFLDALKLISIPTIIVSNEVSFCLIPADELSRRYVKNLTYINKMIAKQSKKVIFMVSGIPLEIKGGAR